MKLKSKKHSKGDKPVVVIGGGRKSRGFSGKWLVIAFLLVFGTLGSVLLYASHADSTQASCTKANSKYTCTFTQAPVRNNKMVKIGSVSTGVNQVICQQQGGRTYNGNLYTNWYAWMQSDQKTDGWVSVSMAKGATNNGLLQAVPNCSNAHGAAPLATANNPHDCVGLVHGERCNGTGATCDVGFVPTSDKQLCVYVQPTTFSCASPITGGVKCSDGSIRCTNSSYTLSSDRTKCVLKSTTSTTNKSPTSPQKPTPVTCTTKLANGVLCSDGSAKCNYGYKRLYGVPGQWCQIDNSVVEAYNDNNDGCGGNATHYASNKTTHVSQEHYGVNSVCKCSGTGAFVAYRNPIADSRDNTACFGSHSTRTPPSGQSKTGSPVISSGHTCTSKDAFGQCHDPSNYNCGAHGQYHYNDAKGCGCLPGWWGTFCLQPPKPASHPSPQPQPCNYHNAYLNTLYCARTPTKPAAVCNYHNAYLNTLYCAHTPPAPVSTTRCSSGYKYEDQRGCQQIGCVLGSVIGTIKLGDGARLEHHPTNGPCFYKSKLYYSSGVIIT